MPSSFYGDFQHASLTSVMKFKIWAGSRFNLCIISDKSGARLMQAQVHQRKFAEDQSLNIDTPPIKVSLKRKAVNVAKSTAWYTSAAFLFVIATCHTLVGFITLSCLRRSSPLRPQVMYVLAYRWFKGIPLTDPFW